jgi:hypothetical protein
MRRAWMIGFVLCLAVGCAADGGKGPLDEALKDWRGDNMRMRSSFADTELVDRTSSLRPSH